MRVFLLPHTLAEPSNKTQLHRSTGDTSQPGATLSTTATVTQVAQTLGGHTRTTPSHTPQLDHHSTLTHTHYTAPSQNLKPASQTGRNEMHIAQTSHTITPQHNHSHKVPCR